MRSVTVEKTAVVACSCNVVVCRAKVSVTAPAHWLLFTSWQATRRAPRCPTLSVLCSGTDSWKSHKSKWSPWKRRLLPALSWLCVSLDRLEQPLIMGVCLMERSGGGRCVRAAAAACWALTLHWCWGSRCTHPLCERVGPQVGRKAFSKSGWSEVAAHLPPLCTLLHHTYSLTAGRCHQQPWHGSSGTVSNGNNKDIKYNNSIQLYS